MTTLESDLAAVGSELRRGAALEAVTECLRQWREHPEQGDEWALRVRAALEPVAGVADATRPDQERRVYSLRELFERPELLAPPVAVIPKIVYRGRTTLFSSREKVGKTTLLANAATAKSTGGLFLGDRLTQGVVVWATIDEALNDTVRRFESLGADPDHLHVLEWRPNAREWRELLAKYRPDMAVIDTLSELWNGAIESDAHNVQIAAFLRPFVEAARVQDVGQVFSHHTNKGGAEYRGGGALGALVDAPLTLRRRGAYAPGATSGGTIAVDEDDDDQADDGRRLLVGMTRWGKVRIRLRSNDGEVYELDGSAPKTLAELLLGAIDLEPGRSGSALATTVGKQKQAVLAELLTLKAANRIVPYRRGWWLPGQAPDPRDGGSRKHSRNGSVKDSRRPRAKASGTDFGTDSPAMLSAAGTAGTDGDRAGTDRELIRERVTGENSATVPDGDSYKTQSREPNARASARNSPDHVSKDL